MRHFKECSTQKNNHRSYVFASNESLYDSTFVYKLIGKLVSLLRKIVLNLEISLTSQYRNKIFKIISCHIKYFGCDASWNYMEAGHWKDPCDSIGGVAKLKVDEAVKNGKFIIQDAIDFFEWV